MKARRQLKILELIENHGISTQEELAEKLGQNGFDVTQATVSRDIKELRLLKIPTGEDTYRYAAPSEKQHGNNLERLKRIVRDSVTSINHSENLIVIRTLPGNAMPLASLLDVSKWSEIIGTVGGDDTILVIVKPKEAVSLVVERLESLF
ncbi:MAG TPA: arginine repressor [Candidatus Deferrimicrobium sp.]|nr:arginine repressor [Candidatus Deferrimicrobium sp.]